MDPKKAYDPGLQTSRCSVLSKATFPSTSYPVPDKQMFRIKGHTLPPVAASSQDGTTPTHKVPGNQESQKSFQDIQFP